MDSGSTQAGHSPEFGNSCLATENVADGPIPMANGSPHRKRPNLISPDYAGAHLPCTKPVFDLEKARNNFVHLGSLRRIVLDHVVDKRLHKLEPMIFLSHISKNDPSVTDVDKPGYNIFKLSSRNSKCLWEMGYTSSCRPGARARICRLLSNGRQAEAHCRTITAGKTEIDEKVYRWPSGPRIRLRLVKISTLTHLDKVKRFEYMF